jgi:hypothetical protein
MGTTCCQLSIFCSLGVSDWIELTAIIVNMGLTYWIVKTIQNKLTNKRVLKDHFINEIKDIRNEYKSCLNNLYSSNTHPQRVIPWFKLMNIRVNDIMILINEKYKIDIKKLEPYQNELRELVTNNNDFIAQFKNEKIAFSEESRSELIKFQQTYNKLFNELIIGINDSE